MTEPADADPPAHGLRTGTVAAVLVLLAAGFAFPGAAVFLAAGVLGVRVCGASPLW